MPYNMTGCLAAAFFMASLTLGRSIHTVELMKQYVPVEVNGRPVVHKTAYFGTVHVGYPNPQKFTVVFDTGSAHFFLPSSACETETCRLHRRYNRSASSSANDIDHDGSAVAQDAAERDQVSLAYGTGEVVGEFVNEVVCLAPPPSPTLEVADGGREGASWESAQHCTKARVVLASKMSDEPFRKFKFDGVLGLGMEALSLNPAFNFFGQMSRGTQMPPVFAIYLAQSDDVHSEISFGGHNPDRMAGPMQWVPVAAAEHGFWQVKIKRAFIGTHPVPLCEDGECQAILDSGTSLLGVPSQGLQKLHYMMARKASASAGADEEADCRREPGPALRFELEHEGLQVQLEAEDYSRPAPMKVPSKTGGAATSVCRASLLPVDMPNLGSKIFIWGEPILRRYYTAYDSGLKRIGFAPARQPSATLTENIVV